MKKALPEQQGFLSLRYRCINAKVKWTGCMFDHCLMIGTVTPFCNNRAYTIKQFFKKGRMAQSLILENPPFFRPHRKIYHLWRLSPAQLKPPLPYRP